MVTASAPHACGATLAVNPHLKRIFGYPPNASDDGVIPLASDRFVDGSARDSFFDRLISQGMVADHLLRMRRLDGVPVWIEVTAHADTPDAAGNVCVQALLRDVSER